MTWLYFVPLALVAATTAIVTPFAHRLRPRVGTWCLTGLAVAGVLATAGSAAALIANGLPAGPQMAERFGWCRHLVGHGSRPAAAASAALAAMAAGNVVRLLRRERRAMSGLGDGSPLRVVDLPSVGAFAIPGRPGTIMVTTGMLAVLSFDERRAMFAHERAHLDLSHHRYVRTVSLAAAAVPVLRPLVRRVQFTTERWADEHAAREVGARSSVAQALVRAALDDGREPPMPTMAAASLGVAARVRALDTEPRRSIWDTVAVGAVLASLAGAATQLHHLATLISHLCG